MDRVESLLEKADRKRLAQEKEFQMQLQAEGDHLIVKESIEGES